jgi:hypothetical protein
MSNIYCSQCGSKHVVGSKFCSSCGSKLGGFNNFETPQRVAAQPVIRKPDLDEEGIPTSFVKPARLAYEIEKYHANQKFSVSEVLSSPPSNDRITQSLPSDFKVPTKEEYLKMSLKECSSTRTPSDIDET